MKREFFDNLSILRPLLTKWLVAGVVASTLMTGLIVEAMSQNSTRLFGKIEYKTEKAKSSDKIDTVTINKEKIKQPIIQEISDQPKPKSVPTSEPKPPLNPEAPRPQIAGNGYASGNCTWYAKSKRSDLPNNLGNANTWASRAKLMGFSTGAAPKVGAVGQQGMHVVFVEAVNADGTVTISEMNFNGLGVISRRTIAAGTFTYIY